MNLVIFFEFLYYMIDYEVGCKHHMCFKHGCFIINNGSNIVASKGTTILQLRLKVQHNP